MGGVLFEAPLWASPCCDITQLGGEQSVPSRGSGCAGTAGGPPAICQISEIMRASRPRSQRIRYREMVLTVRSRE
jgi:hypothetical protein